MKYRKKLTEKKWYPAAVAICIGVVLYVALTHLPAISNVMKTIGAYFEPVILGIVIAYMVNPLAELMREKVFKGVRREPLRWILSVAVSVAVVLLVIVLLLVTLIPQLIESISLFAGNIDRYAETLMKMLEKLGYDAPTAFNIEGLINSSENLLTSITGLLSTHLKGLVSKSAGIGKGLVNVVIAAILSVYLLMGKKGVQEGAKRLLNAILSDPAYEWLMTFLGRCNNILIRYIVYSILDAIIIGGANAIFMAVTRMEYIGLISVLVGVTNLIPTFGPLIGGVIGAFVLLMANPPHAMMFVIFTMILQFCDGYIIKPKLFGDSLGVSGLLIMVFLVVCGNMFGIIGILLSIPLAAIADFVYREELVPALERNKQKRKAMEELEKDAGNTIEVIRD